MASAVEVAVGHRANFLLAELVGAALTYGAAIRVTPRTVGKTWADVMSAHGVDFRTVEP
jgi:hypothetical protein